MPVCAPGPRMFESPSPGSGAVRCKAVRPYPCRSDSECVGFHHPITATNYPWTPERAQAFLARATGHDRKSSRNYGEVIPWLVRMAQPNTPPAIFPGCPWNLTVILFLPSVSRGGIG